MYPRDRHGRYYNPETPTKPLRRRRQAQKVTPISCRQCGTVFRAFKANAKYCSDACRQAASTERRVELTDKERRYLDHLRGVPQMAAFLNAVQAGKAAGKRGLKDALYAIGAFMAAHRNISPK